VLLEQVEHWQLEGRRMFSAESMAAIAELENLPGPAQTSRLKGATPKPEVSKDAAPCLCGGGSDLAQRKGAGARTSSQHSSLTLTIQVRSSAKLDKSIVSFQHG
jgi:hypothetical protein